MDERVVNAIGTISSLYPTLTKVEKKVADFIIADPENLVHLMISDIAEKVGVARSSIVRFCKVLGFAGFKELKINIATNLRKTTDTFLLDIQRSDDPATVLSKVYRSAITTLEETLNTIDRGKFAKAVKLLRMAKRIEFYGVGTSAVLAMDAYYRFMRAGMPAYVAVDPHIQLVSASMASRDWVVVGISHTGRTRDTYNALKIAKEHGAKTICITNFMKSPIASISDVSLVTVSPETMFLKEAITSRIAHVTLLDGLYTAVALANYEKSNSRLENMARVLNDSRL